MAIRIGWNHQPEFVISVTFRNLQHSNKNTAQ